MVVLSGIIGVFIYTELIVLQKRGCQILIKLCACCYCCFCKKAVIRQWNSQLNGLHNPHGCGSTGLFAKIFLLCSPVSSLCVCGAEPRAFGKSCIPKGSARAQQVWFNSIACVLPDTAAGEECFKQPRQEHLIQQRNHSNFKSRFRNAFHSR